MLRSHNHQHNHPIQSLNSIFILSILLNAAFVIVEAGVGFYENSLGLISDAGHNLGDVFSLILAMVAFRLTKLHGNHRFTYGYQKSTVMISLLNAIILLVAVGAIIVESIYKFKNPTPIDGEAISWTAGIGIVVNGITAWMLMKSQKHDINVRGAFLYMAADTLVSLGVVISGLIITFTGWDMIDPIISLVIAVMILISTWKLLAESMRLSLDAVPEDIDYDKVVNAVLDARHVKGVHHIHIWAISTTNTAMTAHVVVDDISKSDEIRCDIEKEIIKLGITHPTLEIESTQYHCNVPECV